MIKKMKKKKIKMLLQSKTMKLNQFVVLFGLLVSSYLTSHIKSRLHNKVRKDDKKDEKKDDKDAAAIKSHEAKP